MVDATQPDLDQMTWQPRQAAEASGDVREDADQEGQTITAQVGDGSHRDGEDLSSPLEGEAELDRLIDNRLINMMYQPITALLDDLVVGYEALARGPENSPLATPSELFRVAADTGRLKDLDLHLQSQAVVQSRDVLLKSGHALFVNVDASVLVDAAFGRDPDAAQNFSSLLTNVTAACPVVLEISDRHEFETPTQLLAATLWARAQGFRVGLDDIGVNPRSLALLPLIEPDVIKLERGILTAEPDADLGLLLTAVRTQAERTGAAVVCQGIEHESQRQRALSFGATHGQGFAIGYPEELSEVPPRMRSLEPVAASWGESCATPFELVATSSQLRTGDEDLITALTLELERQAEAHEESCLLALFEGSATGLTDLKKRYRRLAKKLRFVVAIGEKMNKMAGVYLGQANPAGPLRTERAIVVLTPQLSVALLARVLEDAPTSASYAYTLVYDRGLVTRAARMLIAHIDT